jgi:hypothetical protein
MWESEPSNLPLSCAGQLTRPFLAALMDEIALKVNNI